MLQKKMQKKALRRSTRWQDTQEINIKIGPQSRGTSK